MVQLVDGRSSGNGDAPLEEAMVAALHKYINEHRRGRRPAAEEPLSSAARRLGRGQAAMATQRTPAAVHKPAVGGDNPPQVQQKQNRKRLKRDVNDQSEGCNGAHDKRRKTRAGRKVTDGATTAADDPLSEEDGGDTETEADAPAAKRPKGKKKLKPRASSSAAEAIGNVALGDGGSGVLQREESGAGATALPMRMQNISGHCVRRCRPQPSHYCVCCKHLARSPGAGGGGRRRKGDEEFERQLEMAMMATEASGTLQNGRQASGADTEASAGRKKGSRWQVRHRQISPGAKSRSSCTQFCCILTIPSHVPADASNPRLALHGGVPKWLFGRE